MKHYNKTTNTIKQTITKQAKHNNTQNKMSLNSIFTKIPTNLVFKIMGYNYLETPAFKAIKTKIQTYNKEENKTQEQEAQEQEQLFILLNNDEYISLPKISFKEWYFYEIFLEHCKNKTRYFETEEYFSDYDDFDF